MLPRNRQPTHPGRILANEFLKPYRMTQRALAKKLGLSLVSISRIITGKQSITPETALLLSKAFGTTSEIWMNLQRNHDLWAAKKKMGNRLQRISAVG